MYYIMIYDNKDGCNNSYAIKKPDVHSFPQKC